MSIRLPLIASLMVAASSAAAMAQAVSASVPDTIVLALQDLGYKAQLDVDSEGDPKIKSATQGVNYTIFFYGCEDDGTRCEDIILTAGFEMDKGPTMEAMNSWNATKLTGAAFVDDEGDPNIEHFIAGVDGMSRASFERLIFRWDQAIEEFTDFIDW